MPREALPSRLITYYDVSGLCCCCCCILPVSTTNGCILWGLILRYLVIYGMLLKIRPERAEYIIGAETCLIHPGSREQLFKYPTLTGHVLLLGPTLYICAYICMPYACAHIRTHAHARTHAHTHTHVND